MFRKRDEWQEDVTRRQRNVLVPDIYRNLGDFWGHLAGKTSLTVAQWIGLLVIGAEYCLVFVFEIVTTWPRGQAPWWQKLIYGYWLYFIVWVAIVASVIVGNRMYRRSSRSSGSKDHRSR